MPEKFSMAMCEYAWTSFNENAKWFEMSAVGQQGRFHPTQKPVVLYKWILSNYAKDGDKILDTHVGSASSLIACEDMGFKYVGFEIDKEYYRLGKERLKNHKAQVSIMELMNDWRLGINERLEATINTMSKQLKSGDTIQCHDYSEMRDVLNTLSELGFGATVTVGYTIRIESVPERDETEQDGFITRTMK